MMNPRAIAVQGIGFAVAFIAVQGFVLQDQKYAYANNPDRPLNTQTKDRPTIQKDADRLNDVSGIRGADAAQTERAKESQKGRMRQESAKKPRNIGGSRIAGAGGSRKV